MNPRIDVSDLIGVPFIDMGRGPLGYDCWGAVIEVRGRGGLQTPDYHDIHYYDTESLDRFVEDHRRDFEETKEPDAGDVVLFKRVNGHQHFAAMIDNINFFHVHPDFGGKVDNLNTPYAKTMVKGIYR
jgi:hypothetical protein